MNVCDNNEIEKIFEKYGNLLKLFYAETCSNPSGQICDLQKIQDLKNKFSPEASIVIDNTWVSHINFNPFKYNVDYVILSLTKHYACGDTIAGAIIGSKNVMTDVILYEKIAGIHITSDQCLQILENCKNIASRIERAVPSKHLLSNNPPFKMNSLKPPFRDKPSLVKASSLFLFLHLPLSPLYMRMA